MTDSSRATTDLSGLEVRPQSPSPDSHQLAVDPRESSLPKWAQAELARLRSLIPSPYTPPSALVPGLYRDRVLERLRKSYSVAAECVAAMHAHHREQHRRKSARRALAAAA